MQGNDFSVLDQAGADVGAAEVNANEQGMFGRRSAFGHKSKSWEIFTLQVKSFLIRNEAARPGEWGLDLNDLINRRNWR